MIMDDDLVDRTLQFRIKKMIVDGILSGRFKRGAHLPSSRQLAGHFGISRISVTLAYRDLVYSGYLASRPRSGYHVALDAPLREHVDEQIKRPLPPTSVDWSQVLANAPRNVRSVHRPNNWQSFEYNFIYGQADPTLIDHHNWRKSAIEALGKRDFHDMIQDRYHRDDPQLISYIINNTLLRRGIHAEDDEVLITLGAQHALWMSVELLLNQRRLAVLENPGYPDLTNIVEHTKCHVHYANVDAGGLVIEEIPEHADVVFTTASHQCPTTSTMPIERRRALLARAQRDNFLIVEDDYEFEIPFLGAAKPALKSLDRDGRVIYIGSFSKSMFPGLRLGFIVGSKAFIEAARSTRTMMLRHPPIYLQRIVANFQSLGSYDNQMARIARKYHERHQEMMTAINAFELEVAGQSKTGGSSLWMKARPHIDTSELAARLKSKNVLIEPGEVFFNSQPPHKNFYRIAYSSIPAERIRSGIALIAQTLDEMG